MGKPKEDRSGWVAVAPEFAESTAEGPAIRPAQSAYQIFQKDVTPAVREEVYSKCGGKFELAEFTKAIHARWNALDVVRKARYEDLAREDAARFAKESHQADIEQLERQNRRRQEREELILDDGTQGRSTRRSRKKQKKKQERLERKKKQSNQQDGSSSDPQTDPDFHDTGDSYDSDDSSSYDSDDSDRPKKKKVAPRQVSQAVLERREKARQEKEEKENYIAQRQDELRLDRAAQAKRRLDFLLKQSDIFCHFGKVEEDRARLVSKKPIRRAESSVETGTSRRADCTEDAEGVDAEDMDQGDEHKATFLTAQPSTLSHGKMREYQLEGLNWMIRLQENGVNGILADEMGLGKTLQSISILVYMMEYQSCNGPHLIVVPKSTLSNWMGELERWAPTLTAVKFHGSKEERTDIAENVLQPGQRDEDRAWHVCVTTYEVCNIDKNVLNKFAWSYLIIDEAHRLKNEASTFSQTIRTYETRYRLLLTGTPLQNNLHELWALLNFLVPDVFASSEQFDEWFNLDIDDADEKNKLISQLHKILRPFMLRRLKVDVEKSLPPKRETILFTGMSAMQKKLYKDILLRDIDMIQGGGGSGSRTAILNIVMQLRKCAGHPYLFPGVEDRSLPPLGEHVVQSSGKMVLLDKLLKRLKERGHRVLLFTQMTRILDILEDYMIMRQFQYCRIDGNTSYELREDSIDSFNAPDSKKFIFLLSTRAGGLGINLQTADVVIHFDSDWNPQADLQAQDRAHRIGQTKEVQVFRFVTEHTIEEKIVERAQQKLKLDAMVVQQGRLKDKDKLSTSQLLEAVRFGADKVFKTKDSSITDDDIDMILDAGERKTQEINEKLKNAEKGDMLDFKLDGGISAQTFEGVDYSGNALAQAKAEQAQAQLLGMLDIGKRERRTVANYNENQLYQQQILALQGGAVKERKKKPKRLPKGLRLPRMEEWQMYDRAPLQKLQEEEEKGFRSLPEEQQKMAYARDGKKSETGEADGVSAEKETCADLSVLPPLLSEEKLEQKEALLSEGFAEWGRQHYSAFVKASAKFGRNNFEKISPEVGKPQSAVEEYAAAFWDENVGKKRFSEHEYERVVKLIERGERKIEEIKGLERATDVLVSLFDNPWAELEFIHVNCKDKMFSVDEDRHLLCWTRKYGYGQWGAVKLAIRRSPDFRFDYFLRSLPVELVGRRCEQLMKAAEREVEQLERSVREELGLPPADEKKDEEVTNDSVERQPVSGDQSQSLPIEIPMYKVAMARKRVETQKAAESERKELERKVEDIERDMRNIQERLKQLQEHSKEQDVGTSLLTAEFPDELVPNLANLLARSGPAGMVSVANSFSSEHPGRVSKRKICSKIEDIAVKEKREEDGDTKPMWYVREEYAHLLDADTLRHMREAKEERLQKMQESKADSVDSGGIDDEDQADEADFNENSGCVGPDGTFVLFPEYDGKEPPRECKKAFTHFCNATRKEIKAALDPSVRKDKKKVNSMLKQKWFSLTEDEKSKWKKWEAWDAKRFDRDAAIHEKYDITQHASAAKAVENTTQNAVSQMHIPKKRTGDAATGLSSIPKKRRTS